MRFAEKQTGKEELTQEKAEALVKMVFLMLAEKYGASKVTLEPGKFGCSKIYSNRYVELGVDLKGVGSHTATYDIQTGKMSVVEGFPKGIGKSDEWQVGNGKEKIKLGEPTWGIYFSGDRAGVEKSAKNWAQNTTIAEAPLFKENSGTVFLTSNKPKQGEGKKAYFSLVNEQQVGINTKPGTITSRDDG